MGKRKQKFDWDKCLKVLKEWVPANEPFLWKTARSKINASFEDNNTKRRSCDIATRLTYLAAWSGSEGTLRILTDAPDGWRWLQGALQYWYWSIRILIRFSQLDRRKRGARAASTKGALGLAHALATHEDNVATWLGEKFIQSFEDENIFDDWEANPFGAFMTKLYTLWKGIELELDDSVGVYQQVLDAWHEPDKMPEALVAACDYHCARIDGEEHGLEFEYNPYSEFAAELLAIRRVRDDLGLETPEISHSLLDSPLAHPPERMPEYEDELLERVIELAKQDLPGV